MTFQVFGTDVFYEHKRVATLSPDLYATLLDDVVFTLETADPAAIPEDEHAEAIQGLRAEKDETIKALEDQVRALEGDVEKLEARCDEYETADGTKDALADLRAALEREQAHTANLRELLAKSEATVRRLKGEKKPAKRARTA